jgi:FkbM family methyltransferase
MRTATKIRLAAAASGLVRLGRRLTFRANTAVFTRRGLRWELDLAQGIDFAIYLFGCFEPATVAAYSAEIRPGQVVIDIGANIGAHTLQFARLVGDTGTVVAFEPTAYAFAKLRRNRELNPQLQARLELAQALLVAEESAEVPPGIYSSWPLAGGKELHGVHRGELQSTAGARAVRLDSAIAELGLKAVHHLKLDVDGNEPEVIRGARGCLSAWKPMIFMELAPYLFRDDPRRFAEMLGTLTGIGYRFFREENRAALPTDAAGISALIPDGGSINIVARADG